MSIAGSSSTTGFVEAPALYLNCDKARNQLSWRPAWDLNEAIQRTVCWYREHHSGRDVLRLTTSQIEDYNSGL